MAAWLASANAFKLVPPKFKETHKKKKPVTPAPARFPGVGDFSDTFDPRTGSAVTGGQATYQGSITVTVLDSALVSNVLPVGFSLASRTDGFAGHPIIVMVGHQTDCTVLVNSVQSSANQPDYQEVILLIPFVITNSGTKMHNFVVRMYLDSLSPTFAGAAYNYAKEPANLVESGPPNDLTTTVTQTFLFPLTYFNTTVQLTGPWVSSSSAIPTVPRWPDLQKIFEMPMLGVSETFPYSKICTYWEWDFTNTEVAPALSQYQFLRSFRNGMDPWVQLGVLHGAPDGCVAIRNLRWRIALLPLPQCTF
jgi:hypothetical protein